MENEQINQNQQGFNLDSFQRSVNMMIATNDAAYKGDFSSRYTSSLRDYSEKEIEDIINSGSLASQQKLSRNYFEKNDFYRQIITYYATLLKYVGLLIPNPSYGKKLSSPSIQKRYYQALDYVDKMKIKTFCTNCATRALIDGSYYGIILQLDKDGFAVLDLPSGYARSNLKDFQGNDIIEFDLSYFSTIIDETEKNNALNVYPDIIRKAYRKYKEGKRKRWIILPAEIGICFPIFGGRPPFLGIITSTIQYDKAVNLELDREKEEIRKIIVQRIPHLQDGRLLFEPPEAQTMHSGAVGMLKNNENVSVMTTYADVDAIVSKTSSENSGSGLDRMLSNVYSRAGVSSQLFASTGSSTLESSIKTDIAFMMYLVNKMANFITNTINRICANGNVTFSYVMLPVAYQNESKYIDEAFKLASSGYSLLVPAIVQGLTQKEFIGLKELENEVIDITSILIPPETSYNSTSQAGPGRPRKEQEEKSEKTIANEQSQDNTAMGGNTN